MISLFTTTAVVECVVFSRDGKRSYTVITCKAGKRTLRRGRQVRSHRLGATLPDPFWRGAILLGDEKEVSRLREAPI